MAKLPLKMYAKIYSARWLQFTYSISLLQHFTYAPAKQRYPSNNSLSVPSTSHATLNGARSVTKANATRKYAFGRRSRRYFAGGSIVLHPWARSLSRQRKKITPTPTTIYSIYNWVRDQRKEFRRISFPSIHAVQTYTHRRHLISHIYLLNLV